MVPPFDPCQPMPTATIHWITRFQTFRPLASLPVLDVISQETQISPAYRHAGKNRHDEAHCLFKYTLSGRGVFQDRGGERPVPAGKGFLCEIQDYETAYFYPPDATAPWTFVWVAFTGQASTALVRDLVGRFGPVLSLPPDAPALARLMGWQAHAGTAPLLSPAQSGRLVLDLLLALAENAGAHPQHDPANRLVLRAQDVIRDHLHENLSAGQLADMLHVSREHLTRMFAEQIGNSPYRYIRRQKMLVACRLLKETDLTIKEIARQLGFATQAHFARAFRTELRMPPTRFRQIGVLPIR